MLNPGSRPALKRSIYAQMHSGNVMVLAFTPGNPVVLSNLKPIHLKLLELLDGERSIAAITRELNQAGAGYTLDMVLRQLEVLAGQNLLEDRAGPVDPESFSRPDLARYERNLLYMAAQKPEGAPYAMEIHEKLRAAKVALLGVGGAGNNILQGLAAMGVGHITLVDCDMVEPSNLNRQVLYGRKHIGRPKTEALRELTPELNPDISFDIIEKRLDSPESIAEVITGMDLAILAADSPRHLIFSWTNQAAQQTGTAALFTMGVTQSHVRVGPLVVPGKTVCRDCSIKGHQPDPEHPSAQKINQRYRHGVILPHLQILAGLVVLEAVKHLTGFMPCRIYNHILHQDLFSHELELEPINPSRDCPYCRELARDLQMQKDA